MIWRQTLWLAKKDVLIIEDSLAATILLTDFLKKLGYENIKTCNNGKACIQLFSELETARKRPIVLLDFHLPDMNANEIMTRIFNIRPDTKIILETANSKSDELIKDLLEGEIICILKNP